MFLDVTKAREQLGYEPGFTLSEWMDRTYRWFLDQRERSETLPL